MQRFKSVLLALDGDVEDQGALERAARLAITNQAKLDVVHCLEGMPTDGAAIDPQIAEVWWAVRHERIDRLAQQIEPLQARGVDVTPGILGGIPFVEVIRRIQARGHDLLIKPAQAIGGARDLLFGSTDLHLMRKSPCPVWIHKSSREPRYRRVMAAVDVMSEATDQIRLILDLATSLARREEAELHVVHAWRVPGEVAARGRAFIRMARDQVERLIEDERVRRRAALDGALAEYRERGFTPRDQLIKGDAAVVVPELSRSLGIDLVVMGTVGRTGVPGLLMGNAAEDILRQVDCSVLTVKPAGFHSPVLE